MKTSAIIKTMVEVKIKAPDGYYILELQDTIQDKDLYLCINPKCESKWKPIIISDWASSLRVKHWSFERYLFARKIPQSISMLEYLNK